MGAASHYLEDEGIATTGISLVRDNTERMELPRFLWVPFELGRPFGAPHEPDFQRRVLRAALGLLEWRDGPVVLEDFPDDAPVGAGDDDDPAWSCPVSFAGAAADDGGLVGEVLAELRRLAPWQEMYVVQRGRSAPAASGLSHEQIVRGLGEVAAGARDPSVATNLPLPEWVRLGCDDLRTWYMEAAQGRPGRADVARATGLVLARDGAGPPDRRFRGAARGLGTPGAPHVRPPRDGPPRLHERPDARRRAVHLGGMELAAHWVRGSSDPLPPKAARVNAGRQAGPYCGQFHGG